MSYKNTLLTCASAAALSLALIQPVAATSIEMKEAVTDLKPATEEAVAPEGGIGPGPKTAPAAAVESNVEAPSTPAPPKTPDVAAAAEPPVMPEPPAMPPEMAERRAEAEKRWEARRAEFDRRYEELRRQAEESGMDLPDNSPWDDAPKWLSYDQMRDQMQQQGVDMPESIPWPKGMGPGRMYMSDEERTARREAMMKMSPEQRQEAREQHYQEMRERAAAHGQELPESPPWKRSFEAPKAPEGADLSRMSPEAFNAYRAQKYAEMRERATEHGIELPETPPWMQAPARPPQPDWDKIRETIAGMSDEEREACTLVHRMSMPPSPPPMPRQQMMPQGGGYGHGYPQPDYGYGPDYGRGMGYGHGQGQGYGPGAGYGHGGGYGPDGYWFSGEQGRGF